MQREAVPAGQSETMIGFDLVARPRDGVPFVVMTVYGPESPLCVRLNAPTLGDVIRQLVAMREQLKNLRGA